MRVCGKGLMKTLSWVIIQSIIVKMCTCPSKGLASLWFKTTLWENKRIKPDFRTIARRPGKIFEWDYWETLPDESALGSWGKILVPSENCGEKLPPGRTASGWKKSEDCHSRKERWKGRWQTPPARPANHGIFKRKGEAVTLKSSVVKQRLFKHKVPTWWMHRP